MLALLLDSVSSINTYFVRKAFIFSALKLFKNKMSFNSQTQVLSCVNPSCSSVGSVTDGAISVAFKLSADVCSAFLLCEAGAVRGIRVHSQKVVGSLVFFCKLCCVSGCVGISVLENSEAT